MVQFIIIKIANRLFQNEHTKGSATLKNYNNFNKDMILRDYLALDRTVLANERTFLAYMRTFIGTLSAGVAMVKLVENSFWINGIGWLFIVASPFFLLLGIVRYKAFAKKLQELDEKKD